MLLFSKISCCSSPFKSVTGRIADFRFRSQSLNLPKVDLETLPIDKMELLMTIAKYFQPLTIATKIVIVFGSA